LLTACRLKYHRGDARVRRLILVLIGLLVFTPPVSAATFETWAEGLYDVTLDVLQDLVITRQLTFDPLWTGLFAIGSVLFVILRTMKKRGLLADQAIIRAGQRADEGVVESPRDHAC